jgi:hypothetical protein
MKFRLGTLVLASVAMAAASITAIPAMAATSTTLNVPFSFTVGDQQLPAGLYSVQSDLSGTFVKLQSIDASHSFTWIALPNGERSRVVLKFTSNGQTHVLQSVQSGAMVTPRLDKKGRKTEDVSPQIVIGQ